MRCMVLLVVLISGCGGPEATVPSYTKDLPRIQGEVKHLSAEDRQLLAAYILRHTFNGGMDGVDGRTHVPPGTTIAQAIAQQKEYMRQNRYTAP